MVNALYILEISPNPKLNGYSQQITSFAFYI